MLFILKKAFALCCKGLFSFSIGLNFFLKEANQFDDLVYSPYLCRPLLKNKATVL
jgi:hypothetical protein